MQLFVSINLFLLGATASNLVHASADHQLGWWSATVSCCILANTGVVLYQVKKKRDARFADQRAQLAELHDRLDGGWAADLPISQPLKSASGS